MFRINIDIGDIIWLAILAVLLLIIGGYITVLYIQGLLEKVRAKFGKGNENGDKNEQTDEKGEKFGWGKVLDYIGVEWKTEYGVQEELF